VALNDLEIGTGDVLSVEALQEAVTAYRTAIQRMEAEHIYDGDGRLVHPQPRWATAVAYMGVDIDATLFSRSGLKLRWALGFRTDPRMEDSGVLRWEVDATGPQLVQVGLEWRDDTFDRSFYEEIRFRAGGGNGRGTLSFSGEVGLGEFSPRYVTERISGILLVVRAL